MTGTAFTDTFDTFDETFWIVSDFAIQASFIDTAWSSDNVVPEPGVVRLELDTNDLLGKNFTGAEFKTAQEYWYGSYSVTMQITDEPGVLTSFFMFTGSPFGDPRSEIDIEFRSNDPTTVDLTLHTPDGSSGVTVDLGFDASATEHTYSFEWTQDSVSWFADGVLLHSITAADFTIPEHEGAIFASIWTGSNSFTGTPTFADSTSSSYSEISFTPGTDTTADSNGNLILTALDTTLTGLEAPVAGFIISGMDGDATGTIRVTDGSNLASVAVSANGEVMVDLSGLEAGGLTTSIEVVDFSGNQTTVAGPALVLERSADFSGSTSGLAIDLAGGTVADLARVLPIGDSLTRGVVDRDDPNEVDALREGYRLDLFEDLIARGAGIDYVGSFQNGPDRLLDQDHTGIGGRELRQMVVPSSSLGIRQQTTNLDADVVLLLGGTNDVNQGVARVVELIGDAVSEFFSVPGSAERYLVVATLPPSLGSSGNLPAQFIDEFNLGFSLVGGARVVGDVGNGTYQPGIIATIQALQAQHPTLVLYDNTSILSQADLADGIHLSQAGYALYAAGLADVLENEVGISAGTLAGSGQALAANDVIGGQAGDVINGSDQADTIEGRGGNDIIQGGDGNDILNGGLGNDRITGGLGADTLTGGADADQFVFGNDFATMAGDGSDHILDFGDGADLLFFTDAFVGQVSVSDDAGGGVRLSVLDDLGALVGEIHVEGSAAQDLKGAAQGAGVFNLTTDMALAQFLPDGDLIFG